MTFGLPQNLAPRLVSKSFHRAAHFAAVVSLASSAVILLAAQVSAFQKILWPAFLALIPLAIVLVYLDRHRTTRMASLYLAVGAVTVFVVTWAVTSQLPAAQSSDFPASQFAKIAIVLVGGAGVGRPRALMWGTWGYLVAEASAALAIVIAGAQWMFDATTGLAYIAVVLLAILSGLNASRGRRVEARLRRAAHDDVATAVVYRVEQRASAILHDTVLNHLTTLVYTEERQLNPVLAAELRHDLELVEGATLGESLETVASEGAASIGWAEHPVHDAVRASRASGLDVDITGDPEACVALSPHNGRVAALAITQCLVNVAKHSGVSEAELAIHAAGDEVMFMVIDGGKGFDSSAIDPNRLGIRNSIRGRIESIGGTVQLWTGVGTGTSVVIQVPVGLTPVDGSSEAEASHDTIRTDTPTLPEHRA